MKLTKRSLTEQEINSLVNEIRKTPNILGVTKGEWIKFGKILVAEVGGVMSGVCVCYGLGKKWSNLAILYVLPNFRNRGIGQQLLEHAWRELKDDRRNIYVVSRNAMVIKWLKEKNMKFVSVFALPWEVIKHNLKYIITSPYRISEFLRKLIKFPGEPSFLYAIKKIGNG